LSESPDNKPEQARALLDSSKKYGFRALKLDTVYVAAFLNLGGVYYHLGMADSARYCWEKVNELFPNHPSMPKKRYLLGLIYCTQGKALGQQGKYNEAIRDFRTGIAENDTSADLWYNLGGAYYVTQKPDSARLAWKKTLQLKPDYKEAINGLSALGEGK
jgi:tetratricopeptide (TPR) repeat protein